jgi:hypothetical protein
MVSDTIVLQLAKAAFGRDPERTIVAELKVADTARAKTIRCVGCADLPVKEISDAALRKPDP